jgi:polyribonucleotide nucleotidyltransferase
VDAMGTAREDISSHAPRLYTMKINPERIRDVIGKGGATIRQLTEETGTQIDINEDGTITIASADGDKAAEAKRRIEALTLELEIGKVYDGTIIKLLEFGAIVSLFPGKDGLLHVSQITEQRIKNVADHLKEGMAVRVKVAELDEKGRCRLSAKGVPQADGSSLSDIFGAAQG